jgi:hypothetical protein
LTRDGALCETNVIGDAGEGAVSGEEMEQVQLGNPEGSGRQIFIPVNHESMRIMNFKDFGEPLIVDPWLIHLIEIQKTCPASFTSMRPVSTATYAEAMLPSFFAGRTTAVIPLSIGNL